MAERIREKNLIGSKKLSEILMNENVKILDASWFLSEPKKGYAVYKKNHIPGAIFFDIDFIFKTKRNIPHMMPEKNFFQIYLQKMGIRNFDKIIIYDQIGFFTSCRVWFTLKIFGHKEVLILDGGFKNWIKQKLKTSNLIPSNKKSIYTIKFDETKIKNKLDVKKSISKNEFLIVDARPEERFKAMIDEPRKSVARGKIPSSINIPFNKIFDSNGFLLNDKKLNKIFKIKDFFFEKKIIVSCGSGITACNIIFALEILGKRFNYLYDGSWSEWGRIEI
tara:strand:+ start:358 stop:1191 length:834 start_codon:yes stop_codon:yes gene_type:complete